MIGGVYLFYMFLVSNCLLTYVYEFFIDNVFIVCCLKSRFYFNYLYFFHTCGYAFCLSVSGNIQVDSIELLSTLAIDGLVRIDLCFVTNCQRGSLLGSKDLGFYVFRTLICIVGKP